MKATDYYIGQIVKTYEDGNTMYGEVIEITDKSIKVKWKGFKWGDSDEREYFADEFDKIKTELPIP